MDLRLIEYFIAVVDHGGITRASQAIFIAQPSLSQAIKSLERSVGAELFDRSGRQLSLTAAGREFEVAARRVIADAEDVRERAEAVRELRAGRLQIAAVADLALYPLPLLVGEFVRRFPGVMPNIANPETAADVVAAVRRGEAEIGLTTLPVRTDRLRVYPLRPTRIVLAMTPDRAVGLPDPVPQEMLRSLPLIRGTDDRFVEGLGDPDLLPPASDATLRSTVRQVTWDLVMAGAGVALMPEGIARNQLSGVALREISPELRREAAVVMRDTEPTPAAQGFLDVLLELTSRARETNS